MTSASRSINVWSMKDGTLESTIINHKALVTKITFACDGRFLVSASHDKRIIVFDCNARVIVASFNANSPVSDIQVARDLSFILFAPENIAYLSMLVPNRCLQSIIDGQSMNVPQQLQSAQALAFSLSAQPIVTKSPSKSCIIL